MSDYLLQGWEEIHRELFCRKDGRPVISLATLRQKHGPGLKDSGAVFLWKTGHCKRPVIAGWKNVIQNFFIKLGQVIEAEKKANKSQRRKRTDNGNEQGEINS